MKANRIVLSLLLFTAAGTFSYWVLAFLGAFPVTDIIPGYRDWFMAFPMADAWIIVSALLSAIFLLRGDAKASLSGICSGSAMIFLGLNALLYGINTGLIFNLTVDEIIEIAIKLYCLSVGSYFISHFWNMRNSYA